MPYCVNCGAEVVENARFCHSCGGKIVLSSHRVEVREQVFEGKIHKCPSCGEVIGSFQTVCPSCGFEIRDKKESSAVAVFSERLRTAEGSEEQIKIISSFAIPNNQEDILEFMIIASSNFDEKLFVEKRKEYDLTDAWLSKIETCYEKSKVYVVDPSVKQLVEAKYKDIKEQIKKASGHSAFFKILPFVLIGLGLVLIMTQLLLIQTVGLVLLGSGIYLAIKNSYKAKDNEDTQSEINGNKLDSENRINKKAQKNKSGFSSWPLIGKIFWIILNIYTLGIPAIIYASKRKNN